MLRRRGLDRPGKPDPGEGEPLRAPMGVIDDGVAGCSASSAGL